MKDQLIKYVMQRARKRYPNHFILEDIEQWIRDFFNLYEGK